MAIDSLSSTEITVNLVQQIYLLGPLIINTLPDIDQFKQKIINTRVEDKQLFNAKWNFDLIRLQFLSGYQPEMNSPDNFKLYIMEPQEVTIFSTNSNKGLISIFKKNGSIQLTEKLGEAVGNNQTGFIQAMFDRSRSKSDSL
ncbi:MAG: hypothetical protein O2951_09810 [Bacteroidetes bacterium]|nr:hypothetical protein [Bacteroidota bacterium]